MGGEPYIYFVKYQSNIEAALQGLRQREFAAGRYNPVIQFPGSILPIGPDSPSPGAQHATIEEALEASAEDGTRSILDLDHLSEQPDYCAVASFSDEILMALFQTKQPTHKMIDESNSPFKYIARGQGAYIVIYKDGLPDEIAFAGVSFD